MDFSVVIPVLDEAELLPQCLGALARQSVPRESFEIIVVDNGSTDETLRICERWSDVRLLHQPARDPYLARNTGIEAARGRIVAFTDADCSVAPDWLAQLGRCFEAEEADAVVGRLDYPDGAGFWLERYADYYDAKTEWIFETPTPECMYGHGGNMALRAEIFDRIGLFPPLPLAGDTEILHRIRAEVDGAHIRYAPAAVATHLEVRRFADMLPKLARYGVYSAVVGRASPYRTLTLAERLQVMLRCAHVNRYGPVRAIGLLGVLALGLLHFERGRLGAEGRSTA